MADGLIRNKNFIALNREGFSQKEDFPMEDMKLTSEKMNSICAGHPLHFRKLI